MSANPSAPESWQYCLTRLRGELPAQQFNTWIRPLELMSEESGIVLAAPNRFIRDFVEDKFAALIQHFLTEVSGDDSGPVGIVVGDRTATCAYVRSTR